MKSIVNRSLLIWDTNGDPPQGYHEVVLWNSVATNNNPQYILIPKLVEANAIELRLKYLAWVYDLGNTNRKTKSIKDHMEVFPDFSYWWMTTIAHKPNFYQSQKINDIIKLFALEKHYGSNLEDYEIVLNTDNRALIDVFSLYAKKYNKKFRWAESPKKKLSERLTNLFVWSVGKALLLFIIKAIASIGRSRPGYKGKNGSIIFFDILIHLNDNALTEKRFISNYWTELVDLLADSSVQTTWLHKYFKHKDYNSLKKARYLLYDFSRNSYEKEKHLLLDDFLTFKTVCSAFLLYLKLMLIYIRIGRVEKLFVSKDSKFNFWCMLQSGWVNSLVGTTAVMHCLSLHLFRSAVQSLPYMEYGIYIQENQPWEMALINAWQTSGQGQLIGVPHSTVRFWDLRYFYHPKTYDLPAKNALPVPDIVALNGKNAIQQYLANGYPVSGIVEVEALRYMHLACSGDTSKRNGRKKWSQHAFRILLCGDNIPNSNEKVFKLISQTLKFLPYNPYFVFRPHPARDFDIHSYGIVNIEEPKATLSELIEDCDMMICGNTASAAVDAYFSGLKVAILHDGSSLNTSPLLGFEDGAFFFNDTKTLCDLILGNYSIQGKLRDYFFINKDLSKWKNLLGIIS